VLVYVPVFEVCIRFFWRIFGARRIDAMIQMVWCILMGALLSWALLSATIVPSSAADQCAHYSSFFSPPEFSSCLWSVGLYSVLCRFGFD